MTANRQRSATTAADPRPTDASPDYQVCIVGAGFAGIGTAIALERAGITDWVIFEAADGVGGTWHWNTYPGVGVDIPSFSYQFSYAQHSEWSRTYAPGVELKEYAESLVDEYGLRRRLELGTRVLSADYRNERHWWEIAVPDGRTVSARYLVNASGILSVPKPPAIAGIDRFAGTTMHTARWDHTIALEDRRIAVIGTGASAVQAIPHIAQAAARLTVFQRTPIWCFPKADLPLPRTAQKLLKFRPVRHVIRLASQFFVELTFPLPAHFEGIVPVSGIMARYGRWWLGNQVKDPATRAQLTPSYGVGCKRPGFHNEYLATYNRDNVTLETSPIVEVEPEGIRTADGGFHSVDVLVLATGFKVLETDSVPTFPLTGADGDTLEQRWESQRLHAYEGISIPGFPNFFTIFGPYGYAGASYFTLVEAQSHHIVRCLRAAAESGSTELEVRRSASNRFFDRMMQRRRHQVFWQDSCAGSNSYYFDKHGDVGLRPTSTLDAIRRSRHFDLDDYRFCTMNGDGVAKAERARAHPESPSSARDTRHEPSSHAASAG